MIVAKTDKYWTLTLKFVDLRIDIQNRKKKYLKVSDFYWSKHFSHYKDFIYKNLSKAKTEITQPRGNLKKLNNFIGGIGI